MDTNFCVRLEEIQQKKWVLKIVFSLTWFSLKSVNIIKTYKKEISWNEQPARSTSNSQTLIFIVKNERKQKKKLNKTASSDFHKKHQHNLTTMNFSTTDKPVIFEKLMTFLSFLLQETKGLFCKQKILILKDCLL